MADNDSKVMTVEEIAEYLRVHKSTVYRLLRRGGIPAFKLGSDWRFNIETINDWRRERESFSLSPSQIYEGDKQQQMSRAKNTAKE